MVSLARTVRLVDGLRRGDLRLDRYRDGSAALAYGLLRTAEAVSPLAASTVATTLVLFVLVYGVVFAMGIYYINRLIARGPQGPAIEPPTTGTPARPLATGGKVFVETG